MLDTLTTAEFSGIDDDMDEIIRADLRNPCLAHLLQLAVKDALRPMRKLLERVNEVVNFFTRSNHYYDLLREKTGGIGLLKPCPTRWNSLYACLKRIFTEQRKEVSIMIIL